MNRSKIERHFCEFNCPDRKIAFYCDQRGNETECLHLQQFREQIEGSMIWEFSELGKRVDEFAETIESERPLIFRLILIWAIILFLILIVLGAIWGI